MSRDYTRTELDRSPTWDTLWGTSYGDWNVSDAGDVSGDAELHSLVALCLFTDKRAKSDDVLPTGTDDPRGWFGDFVDIQSARSERELGSWIWLYERSALTDKTVQGIEDAARESLDVILDQGISARIEVDAEADKASQSVKLRVRLFSEDGSIRYDQQFERVLAQANPIG